MIVRVEISKVSLSGITERACEAHKRVLAEELDADDMYDIKCVIECLADVVRLWEAVDNFDADDELLLTIEKREGRDGSNHTD